MAKEVARGGAEVALKIAQGSTARDALVDPMPGDYVPDMESKGYHVGEVRQPAEPVLTDDGVVTFETTSDGPTESKFPSYADSVEKLDKITRGREGVAHVPIPVTADEVAASIKANAAASKASPKAKAKESTTSDLDADAGAVADAQAAEDKG